MLLDVLAVDRSGIQKKDDLVDLLLDFLGEPQKRFLKGSKKGAGGKRGRAKHGGDSDEEEEEAVESEKDDDYSDVDDEKLEDGAGPPSDEALRRWVRAYVRCHNMKNSTVKSALAIASEKFGVDLSDQKQRLKELLTEEM